MNLRQISAMLTVTATALHHATLAVSTGRKPRLFTLE